ncbi:MAG: hypothetical protein ACFCD0_12250 [Gemmataceae bacterium]
MQSPQTSLLAILILVGCSFVYPIKVVADSFHVRKGPATLYADFKDYKDDTATLRLSGVLTLTYTLNDKAPLKAKLDLTPLKREVWEVYPQPPTTSKSRDTVTWQQQLRIEPRKPGEFSLAFPKLQYQSNSEESQTLDWKTVSVKVTTIILDPTLDAIEDIPAIETLPPRPPPPTVPWVTIGTSLGTILVLSVVLVLLVKRFNQRKVEEPPSEGILEQLDRLAGESSLSEAELRERYSQLMVLFCGFLREHFEIPKDYQTSAEVLQWLEGAEGVSDEGVFAVREVIEECDLIRFTPLTPNQSNFVVSVERARDVVERISVPLVPEP